MPTHSSERGNECQATWIHSTEGSATPLAQGLHCLPDGGQKGAAFPAQDEAPGPPRTAPIFGCPTLPHNPPSPMAQGKPFRGARAPSGRGGGGGSRVCSGSLGRSGGPGYILTCYHGNGSGSVAAGRGGCSSPEMLTKGRGKGARLRQGRPWGAASTPPPCLRPGPPRQLPKTRGAQPTRPRSHASPSLPSHPAAPWIPGSHIPTGFLGTDTGETPAKTPADNLAKTGCTGVGAAIPDRTPHRCHFMSPRPCHPGQGLPWLPPTPLSTLILHPAS